jgi:hypothetical protein
MIETTLHYTCICAAGYLALDVGPMPDNSYAYGFSNEFGWVVSEHRYHNAESAKHDARRPQRINEDGNLEPVE